MLGRFHPNQLRYVLLVVNSVLLLLAAWCGVWAFGFHKALWAAGILSSPGGLRVAGFTPVQDPVKEYAIPDTAPRLTGTPQASTVASLFMPPAPPQETEIAGGNEPGSEEPVEKNGVLSTDWVLLSVILYPDPGKSCAFLAEKKPAYSRRSYSTTRRFTSSKSRTQRTSYRRGSTLSRSSLAGRKTVTLYLFDPETNLGWTEVGDWEVRLVEIKAGPPREIVYEVKGQPKKYALQQEEEADQDPFAMKPKPEEEKKKPFGAAFGKKSTGPSGAKTPGWDKGRVGFTRASARSTNPRAPSPRSSPVTSGRKGTEAEKRRFIRELGRLKGKIPPDAEKKLRESLGGRKR